MMGIGMPEIVVILVIGLLVIGPSKLPAVARSLGKGYAEFKKAADEFKEQVKREADLESLKEAGKELEEELKEGNLQEFREITDTVRQEMTNVDHLGRTIFEQPEPPRQRDQEANTDAEPTPEKETERDAG